MTSFNNEILSEMKGAGVVRGQDRLRRAASRCCLNESLEKFDQWNLGRNTDKLAQLLTDPSAASLFRSLAKFLLRRILPRRSPLVCSRSMRAARRGRQLDSASA